MENALHPKRSPLTLVGDAPAYLREAVGVTASAQRLPTNNSYFVLYADPEAALFSDTLEKLLAVGVPADQIFLAYDVTLPEPPLVHAFAGRIWIAAEESLEDLRHRLASALVAQRHRKLEGEITRAEKDGAPDRLGAAEWLLRVDYAHLAHALSLSLELSPQHHGLALRAALEERPADPWPAELSLPQAVAACARVARQERGDPVRFRESFRRLSLALPARLRADLRAAADRCLEALWRAHA